jgi:polysaccharide pyruvyl transferase WcaK-like protein
MEVDTMRKIGVHGSFFGDNFGDTLFAILTSEILEKRKCVTIFSFCADRVFFRLNGAQRGLLKFMAADRIIFTGGGYLGEPATRRVYWNFRFLIRHGVLISLCFILRKKYAVVGVGVGPISFLITKIILRSFLKNARPLIVRDSKSYRFVKEGLKIINVEEASDLVIAYVNNRKYDFSPRPKVRKRIGLHIPISNGRQNLNNLVSRLSEEQASFDFFYFKDFHNPNFCGVFPGHLKANNVTFTEYEYESPESLIQLISTLDGLITLKLHVGVVATTLGIPTLSVATHEKAMRYFTQIGYGDLCCSSANVSADAVNRLFQMVYKSERVSIPESVLQRSQYACDAIGKFCVDE